MNNPLIYCFIVGICWGGMGLIARVSGLGSQWTAIMLGAGTLATTLVGINTILPPLKPLTICFIAGIVNGIGMLAFGVLTSWEGTEVSKVLPIAFALIPIAITFGALIFLGEQLTTTKAIGITVIAIGVYILS